MKFIIGAIALIVGVNAFMLAGYTQAQQNSAFFSDLMELFGNPSFGILALVGMTAFCVYTFVGMLIE